MRRSIPAAPAHAPLLPTLLAAGLAFSLAAPGTAGAAEDKARERTSTASSVEGPGLEAAKAVDGSSATRWSSRRVRGQHWTVDLGRVRKVGAVEINWERAYASRYRVETSKDGSGYSPAAKVALSSPQVRTTRFASRDARYVRIVGVRRATRWGISFRDVHVYGPADQRPAGTPPATSGALAPAAPLPRLAPPPAPLRPTPARGATRSTPTTPTTPAPSPTPTPSPAPKTPLWSADMEEGSLADWFYPETAERGDHGGGVYNSGSGESTASAELPRSGRWAAKMALGDGGVGGTRLFRWQELRANREVVVSAWFYFPRAYTLTGNPSNGQFHNLFQFKSRSTSGAIDPIWYLDVQNPAPGRMRLDLLWWHRTLEGPRPGQSGFRRMTQTAADVPVGRWFELKAHLRQSKDFDGLLRVWQDGQLIYDMPDIRTSFANCAYNAWCGANDWSINNYADGIAETPAVIYADDARIERP